MVVKKKAEEEFEKIRKDRKVRYDVSIRYRDGGVDRYFGVKSANVKGEVLEVIESTSIVTYIVLDIISYFKVEKTEEVSK